MSRKIRETPVWKLALRFSLVFFVFTATIKIFWSLLSKDTSVYFKTEEFKMYMIAIAVFSLVYGFLMAFMQKQKHKRR